MNINLKKIALLYFLILHLVIISIIITHTHNWGGDFSGYILQAKAICSWDFKSFLNKSLITFYNGPIVGPLAYPWGFPLLLAPAISVYGVDFFALKFIGIFFLVFTIIICYKIFEKRLKTIPLCLLLLCISANPVFYNFVNNILSDIPFLFFYLLTIFYIDKIYRLDNLRYNDAILISIFLFCCISIRQNGLVLLFVLIICNLIKRHIFLKNCYKFILLYIILFCAYAVYLYIFPSGEKSYFIVNKFNDFSIIKSTVKNNFFYYGKLIADSIPLDSEYRLIIYGITIPFFLHGVIKHYRSDFVFIISSLLTIALYIIWPYQQGVRFLFPIIPIYFYYVLWSIDFFISNNFRSVYKLYLCYSIIFIICFQPYIILKERKINHINYDGPCMHDAKDVFNFINSHTDKNSIIGFFKPRVLTLMTERYSFHNSPDVLKGDFLLAYKPIDSLDHIRTYILNKSISIVYENNNFILFNVLKPTEKIKIINKNFRN